MSAFLLSVFVFWVAAVAGALLVQSTLVRRFLRLLMPLCFGAWLAGQAPYLVPWQRLVLTTIAMLFLIKAMILLGRRRDDLGEFSPAGLAVYLTVWPGMNPEPFRRRTHTDEDGFRFARGLAFMGGGALLGVAVALGVPHVSTEIVGWGGIFALLLIIHFGYAEILTCAVRLCGWDVQPLFDEPLKSRSLGEFWSKRWNRAFVEMNQLLFLLPLSRRLGAEQGLFAVFVVSGLLHELAISYPALSAWGGPLLYFVIQAVAYMAEAKVVRSCRMSPLARRLWVVAVLLAPLPLLFTGPLRAELIVPLFQSLHRMLTAHDLRWWFGMALWCATLGNILTLAAGIQAPWRLNWRGELCRLSAFNRKIFLNYYVYIGLLILTWAALTIVLRQELMDGDRAAVCLAAVIGCFWGLRVLVDIFFFNHRDWPPGPSMVIGHACLTTLFCFLTATYIGLVIWHASGALFQPTFR